MRRTSAKKRKTQLREQEGRATIRSGAVHVPGPQASGSLTAQRTTGSCGKPMTGEDVGL